MEIYWYVIGFIIIAALIGFGIWWFNRSSDEETTTTTSNSADITEEFTQNVTDEIIVPIHVDNENNNKQYSTNVKATDSKSLNELNETYPYRAEPQLSDYPSNPDLYPDNGVEFRPENSLYTHLENNFLDIGPQIGVGTRVNSQRNGPQLLFRRQYNVPTMPTGYWNQSTISQPIFTTDVC